MAISITELKNQIDSRLAAGPTGVECCQLQGAQCFLNNSVTCVTSTALLPDPSLNEGRFVYVTNICRYVFSNGVSWTSCTDSILCDVGIVYTWGSNIVGQLGMNDLLPRSSPTLMSTANCGWCFIAAGANVNGGICTDGSLWMWGNSYRGALGNNNATVSASSPVSVSGGGNNWTSVQIGNSVVAARKSDNTLWTWGSNGFGALGHGTNPTVHRSSPVQLGGANWSIIAVGSLHMLGKYGTNLCAWGNNQFGQLGLNDTVSRCSPTWLSSLSGTNTTALWAGLNASASITSAGLQTWGRNNQGQLGLGTTVDRSSPAQVNFGIWSGVAIGAYSMSGVDSQGRLWSWGGITGDGTNNLRSCPVTTAGGHGNWCAVSRSLASGNHALALKTDGTLWSWGINLCGQLGDGTQINRSSPVQLCVGCTVWARVAAGSYASTALTLFTKGV